VTFMQLTFDEQLKMMKRLVPEWAIQTDSRVAHGKPWVPHEYVTHMLDTVFGPDCWNFEVGAIKPITLPNNDQLIYVPGKMTVKFADGAIVTRSDVGIGLVQARIDSPDLSDLGIDSFETGYKSATTDALKGCAADLGRCFRPIQNPNMASAIATGRFESELQDVFPDGVRTKEAQVEFLKHLVPVWAIQRDSKVANGKPWVPHEYVVHLLDLVFGASHWSFEIADVIPSPLPNGELLVYVPGQLSATFADGSQAVRSDVGIGVVRLRKNADDLSATPTENFETGFKSAITDALKGCAGDLGRCFRPMLSEAMQNAITRGFFENEVALLRPLPNPEQTLEDNKRALGRDDGDLVSASEQGKAPVPQAIVRKYADDTLVSNNVSEIEAFDAFVKLHSGVVPVNIQVLRDWHRLHTQKTTKAAAPNGKKPIAVAA
jgi:recombination DNA repair RAD52 pathway protein